MVNYRYTPIRLNRREYSRKRMTKPCRVELDQVIERVEGILRIISELNKIVPLAPMIRDLLQPAPYEQPMIFQEPITSPYVGAEKRYPTLLYSPI